MPPRSARFTVAHSTSSGDRKSTRLNSSHSQISYAVFCLKKKNSKNKLRIYWNSNNNIHVNILLLIDWHILDLLTPPVIDLLFVSLYYFSLAQNIQQACRE